MNNKLLHHIIINLCMVSGILIFSELRKRNDMKMISKKLDDTLASMQGLELSTELMGQSLRGNPNYLKH